MREIANRKLWNFARETTGNVAILFGLALIPVILGVGAGADYGRALMVRDRMGNAADAAALAVGSWPGLNEAQLTAKAQQFFDANYPPSEIGTAGAVQVRKAGDNIQVSVSGTVPTSFLRLANISEFDVGVTTVVTKKQRNIELALVLDTTGSMGQSSKMSAMQAAAKKMVKTLFEDKSSSSTLKIGVVPFSGAVNIGDDKLDSGWLDTKSKSAISYEDFEKGVKTADLYKDLDNRDWAGCVRERGGKFELSDHAPTNKNKRFALYFAPDEPDIGNYKNDYIDDDMRGNNNYDERQRDTKKYDDANVYSSSKGPDYNCPEQSVTPLTSTRSTIDSAIEALEPKGNTVIPAGLLWGWRVLSPGEPYSEGTAYGNEKWIKALVLLTDGENSVSGGSNGHNESVYTAFGYAASGHLGNTNGSKAEETLDEKTAEVCSSIKAAGILVYTIGFKVYDSGTQSLLKNCATKPDMYYNSPSNEQLASVFQDIAQGLGELRIAQ
jgi:Flp pilus assembly protein TadG